MVAGKVAALEAPVKKVMQAFQADFDQSYSKEKYFRLIRRGSTWKERCKTLCIIIGPALAAVALTLLPLRSPTDGLVGANLNILIMSGFLGLWMECVLCVRFELMMSGSAVTRHHMSYIIGFGTLMFCGLHGLLGMYYRFPVPFRKLTLKIIAG